MGAFHVFLYKSLYTKIEVLIKRETESWQQGKEVSLIRVSIQYVPLQVTYDIKRVACSTIGQSFKKVSHSMLLMKRISMALKTESMKK